MSVISDKWIDLFREVSVETVRIQEKFGDYRSMHEAYGVLAEEVAEFFEEVRKKQSDPTRLRMCRQEAIDVAVVALRIVFALTNDDGNPIVGVDGKP